MRLLRPLGTMLLAAVLFMTAGCSSLSGGSSTPAQTSTSGTTNKTRPSLRLRGPVLQVPLSTEEPSTGTVNLSAYRLKSLDPLFITLRGIPVPEEIEDRIDEDGEINLPHIGSVRAAGLTTSELEQIIEKKYVEEQIYRTPSVNVVVPAQSYYVRGEVRNPGRYPLITGITLLQAIAAAGGYTEFANPKKTQVTRAGKARFHNLIEMQNTPEKDRDVESGDVIWVPRSPW